MRSAQIAGAMQAALALAVDHANTRKQFGRPIGRFQAVQQQLAVFAAETSAASVAAAAAARAVDRRGLAAAAFEIGCAKITVGEAATRGAAIAHQVFAAMGITEEHQLHHFTRRLWSWREEGGSEAFWARRIGQEAQALPGALWPFITAREEEIAP
jgi:acyl-CoA dehydrogenase